MKASKIATLVCFLVLAACDQAQLQRNGGLTKAEEKSQASATADETTIPLDSTEEKTATNSEGATALEPVAVGGAFLVCMEAKKGPDKNAMCRLESMTGERMSTPINWEFNFYADTDDGRVGLGYAGPDPANPDYSWQIALVDEDIEELTMEIKNVTTGLVSQMIPIMLDPQTGKAKKDPRVKPEPMPPPAPAPAD